MSAKSAIAEMRKTMREQVRAAFHHEAAALFEKHPDLEGFRWTQYTPYFNDGDECTFSAHTDYFYLKFKGVDGEDDENDEGYAEWSDWGEGKKEVTPLKLAGRDVEEFLGAFEEDEYKHLFGDHKQITVTRKGISVEGYNHD